MQTTLSQTIREIAIDRWRVWEQIPSGPAGYGVHPFPGTTVLPEEVLSSKDLVAQIENALAADVRVLLVKIAQCGGGDSRAGDQVYRALRRFSDEPGRKVVCHVRGVAASSAVKFALAADLLVIDPDAEFWLHGSVGPSRPQRLAADAQQRAVWLDRSAMPAEMADRIFALSPGDGPDAGQSGVRILSPTAISWLFADALGDIAMARRFAEILARGNTVHTPRSQMLRERKAAPVQCGFNAVVPTALYTVGDAMTKPIAPERITEVALAPTNLTIGSETFAGIPVLGRAHIFANAAWAQTGEYRLNFDTEDVDTNSAISTGLGTWAFTVPTGKTGHYFVHAHLNVYTASGGTALLRIYRNGVEYVRNYVSCTTQYYNAVDLACVMPSLPESHTIYATLEMNVSATVSVQAGAFMEIWRLQPA